MGFSLTISAGQERGREYTFSQAEVSIGRTAENDVVLGDPGVSRRHVMIREEGGKFYVQDLGSANGTKVNGNAVTEDELRDGDDVHVGPVIFSFAAMATEGSTRIFDPADVERKMLATKQAKQQAAARGGAGQRSVTAMQPALKASGTAGRRPNSGPSPRPNSGSSKPGPLVKKAPSAPPAPASARARARREAKTLPAKLKLFWSEADKKVRIGIMGVGGVVLLGLVAVVLSSSGHGPTLSAFDQSKQKFQLSPDPTKDSYGLGDSVSVATADKVQFEFNFPVTAKKATATLHFSAGSIAKAEEVDVSVNAVHMGFVTRSFGDEQRTQDIPLVTKYLHANAKNLIVFDNLKNPPGKEPWVVSQVWVEVQQLPDAPPPELRQKAKYYIDLGDRAYEFKLVGAPNRYNAWVAYKKAKLFLDALDEKTDDYDIVRQKIRDSERDLDALCAQKMLQGAAAEQQGHPNQAIKIYKGALDFFPEKDHPCFQQLHGKLVNLE